jgi:DNA-binding NtrC family response regulator
MSVALVLHRTEDFAEHVARIIHPLGLVVRSLPLRPLPAHVVDVAGPTCSLVVVDFGDGAREVVELLRTLRKHVPAGAVVAVADPGGASPAVEAMADAVDDYVLAPPLPGELLARCRRVMASRDLHRRLELLQVELNRRYGAHRIVCRSQPMETVYNRVLQLAPTRTTVLISGESGAGKELVARSLHYNSDRRDHPFIAVNCAAISETLIESELFGHQRGAFTGAIDTVPGKFELADGGTLFLDEVGSMSRAAQIRFLRVLEEGEFMRVGGKRTIRVDVRVIAATNTDLEDQVRRGEFRKDLMYRLKVAGVEVPPLRKRADDVPVLARTFVRQLCEENGIPVKDVSPEFVQALVRHDWPGNVRELKNLLESLVVTVTDRVLLPDHLPESLRGGSRAPTSVGPRVGTTLREMERQLIEETLRALHGNRTRAARTLGIGVRTLQRKLKEHGIDVAYVPALPHL